jgi:hypothetical protein
VSDDAVRDRLTQILDPTLLPLLEQRDGPARLLERLPIVYPPNAVGPDYNAAQEAWDLTGVLYSTRGRHFEAMSLYTSLYYQMLRSQTAGRIHKGTPLVRLADSYSALGYPVHAKRYLMLTLCEDALRENGDVSPETTGIYFRLIWGSGLPEAELKRYARQFNDLAIQNPERSQYPEWLLQEVDAAWLTEVPSPSESGLYVACTIYVDYLLDKLGEGTGEHLELLAEYLLSCMPGCRTMRRGRSGSTDYDVVCAMGGFEVDFRSEFGRYFVCECKDWKNPADFTVIAKFCRVLDSTKARFGILFSKSGLSGASTFRDARLEQIKIFQDRGIVIVVVDSNDITQIATGAHFAELLRHKYEEVRLDLRNVRRDAG